MHIGAAPKAPGADYVVEVVGLVKRLAEVAQDDLREDHGVLVGGCGGAQRAAGRPAASQAFMPPAIVATSSRCRAARRAASALR